MHFCVTHKPCRTDFNMHWCRKDNGLPYEESLLYLRMESGDPTVLGSKWDNSLFIAAGKDPFILIEKAVAAAAQLSGGAQQRQVKQQPDSLNWFGWCTWDAYYSKVSARGKPNLCLWDATFPPLHSIAHGKVSIYMHAIKISMLNATHLIISHEIRRRAPWPLCRLARICTNLTLVCRILSTR